ncbi:MAG: bifunctional (p)ppGpp synthetase/guanosine-3',5'-bis(diphosphate) 3'-pyrophosphohydrolase [Sphingomonadales bacterium]|nr:MAG: bifunctional (p)ppGpp synthetase/guanosine-3',5'-bis(diphosphate) 3'-pyrophosphohydrolase [Sphingomonadales bacterium]
MTLGDALADPADRLTDAIMLACSAHRGQVDKAGAPYILHSLRVMLAVTGEDQRIAAVLHDVVEDCGVDVADIAARFGAPVAQAVLALSRRDGEEYDVFITRCAADSIARTVKCADLADNLDLSRLPAITPSDMERAEKYRRSLDRLRGP